MSQSSPRSAVFLQEMGVGAQWKLRSVAVDDGFAEAVQALADGLPEQDVPPVTTSAPAPFVAQAAPPVAVQPAVSVAPAASPAAAPAAVAAAAAAAVAPVATPSGDESTAWFDDAPVPAPAAAPRPAPARPAPVPASRTAAQAAQSDDLPPDEDTAWFDDAPAPVQTSAPAPARAGAVADSGPATSADADAATSAPVSDEAIASMDWPALQAAVSSCTRCPLCETRRAAVNGRGAEKATWIAFAGAPSALDEQDVQAVTGEAGQLLQNMLKAIALKPEADVYVTNIVKCRPPERNPTADEVIACRPYLDRELALTGATMAMTFGQFAAKGLMMGPAARGKVMHYGANKLPVVATYHPDDLLRKPEDKAKAWADLCLAKASHA
jgi:DNA polymerase